MVKRMAKKRKTQKKKQTQCFGYSSELIGILLVLIGILGFGFGTVGNLIKEFAMFLVGEWWSLIIVYTLVMGILMVFRRQLPNFFSVRLIGIYIAFIVVLVATHFSFIKAYEPDKIINATMESFKLRVASMNGNAGLFASGLSDHAIGGGIIGALFSWGFASLFDSTGTIIVLFALVYMCVMSIRNRNKKVKSNLFADIICSVFALCAIPVLAVALTYIFAIPLLAVGTLDTSLIKIIFSQHVKII